MAPNNSWPSTVRFANSMKRNAQQPGGGLGAGRSRRWPRHREETGASPAAVRIPETISRAAACSRLASPIVQRMSPRVGKISLRSPSGAISQGSAGAGGETDVVGVDARHHAGELRTGPEESDGHGSLEPLSQSYNTRAGSSVKVKPMSATFWLRAASAVTLLYAIGHALGGLESWSPAGPTATLDAMRSFEFDVMGRTRTYLDFYLGFGHYISALLLLQAALLWQLGAAAARGAAGPAARALNVCGNRRRHGDRGAVHVHRADRDVRRHRRLPGDRTRLAGARGADRRPHCERIAGCLD